MPVARDALASLADGEPSIDTESGRLALPVKKGTAVLPDVVRELDLAGVTMTDLAVRRPTLDDVFLTLTGHVAEEESTDDDAASSRRRRKGGRR